MAPNIDWNNLFRSAAIAGLKSVPEVGTVLSALTTVLWPADNSEPLDQLKTYVDQMMHQLLDETKVDNLRTQIEGLKDNMQEVATAESSNKKASGLRYLINTTTNLEATFFPDTDDQPWATMTYLVAFGCIRIGLLREQWLHYEDIWGDPDTNPDLTFATLTAAIITYSSKVQTGLEYAIKWRTSCITLTKGTVSGWDQSEAWRLADSQDASVQQSWTNEYGGGGQPAATIGYQNHVFDVIKAVNGFGANLTGLASGSITWPFFSTAQGFSEDMLPPNFWFNRIGEAQVRNSYQNPNPDPPYVDWDDEQVYAKYGPISHITICWDSDMVTGIEVWYGGTSSGFRGASGTNSMSVTFQPGESITAMGVSSDYYFLGGFWVNTNVRVVNNGFPIGGGSSQDTFAFSTTASVPIQPAVDRLAYLSGFASSDRIGQIRPAWARNVY